MKRFIIMLSCILLTLTSCTLANASEYTYEGYTLDDMYEIAIILAEQDTLANAAHQMAESGRLLGYNENHSTIVLAKKEYQAAIEKKEKYQKIYDNLNEHWQAKKVEYPTATYVWEYFRNLGYNKEVVAGIVGNMMAEVGGQTLALNYESNNGSYYGLCQWSETYSGVWGASLKEQCEYLQNTIRYEIDTYGYAYKKNFNYEKFLKLNSAEKAAKCFAAAYERCGKASYEVRQSNAAAALEYFQS